MKLCTKCKTKKKNSEFSFCGNSKDKLQGYCKSCKAIYNNDYRATKEGYINHTLLSSKSRAKNKKVKFNLDIEYLQSISTDRCPVFDVKLIYSSSFNGRGFPDPYAAALDRVIPELGYVKGNVVFISQWANSIKSDATEVQLYAVADWLHAKRKEVLNAFKEQLAPVSERAHIQGDLNTQPGTVPAPGFGEDNHYAHHYSGTICGEDTDHSAQASSGDGMGCRGKEMATLVTSYDIQNYGEPNAEAIITEQRRRYLLDKP